MLTSAELASMRSAAEEALPSTAVVSSQAFVSDGGGEGTATWAASGTFDCRIAPAGAARGSEVEEGERISPEADFIVTLPFGTSITEEQRMVIDSETYRVVAVRDRSWHLTKRVEVTRHTP